jgi:hypothetical protein|tara:strand:+ start:176 stop:376 length:201 start_codon:yes stop_codon:yes gene_type:complete
VLRLANKQGVEERSRRRRVRDGLAAPRCCSDEQSRLHLAQRFGGERERRDGTRRQEIDDGGAHIVA